MTSIRRGGVWQYVGGALGRQSLSVLARNPNKGLELDISGETRSGGGKEGPREDRSIWQRNPERGSQQRRAEESGQLWVGCPENDRVNRSQKGDC